jgi:two-component system, OmpR family, sensor kinase
MFGSLRFRLPALFLAGIVFAGIVSAAIALSLFQSYTRDQSLRELKREAIGLSQLYAEQALQSNEQGSRAPSLVGAQLEKATGDRLFYVGVPIFPGQSSGLTQLPRSEVDWPALRAGRVTTFEFKPPGEHRTFLAVGNPLKLEPKGPAFGALIVAKPKTELRHTSLTLLKFVAFSLLGGLLVAGALAWYLSHRITRPLLGLSRAADAIAKRRYDVPVPEVRGGGEVGHLADRFREMATRIREAEELERNFLMSVSHELRTPLTAIRGHVAALREGLADDPEARAESLDVVADATGRLERLVGDVLDLAKLDARRFTLLHEEVDMGRVLDQAYASFGEEARRREIDYRCEVDARPVILSDGDRVLQIISNLLTNAFRWTPDGGRVDLSLAAENGAVRVGVADTGPGIAATDQERIFRPFWSRDGAGTGLGLAIANELATALGGRIELETEPGGGSRFALVLPATPAE